MVTYSALSRTILPMSVGTYRMERRSKNQLIISNAGKISYNTTLIFYNNTVVNKGYKGVVAPLGQTLIPKDLEDELQQSVKKIKRIMANKLSKPAHMEDLIMIDAIQRLGLELYFQDDIYATLDKHYERHCSVEGGECLHDVALRFRLLRQQGYHVSEDADTFIELKDSKGKFKQEITKDTKAIMSLYEASHLKFTGDHVLDVAGEFSGSILKGLKDDEEFRAKIIGNTLKNPCHKSWAKLTSKIFLHNFETSLKFLHDFSSDSNWIREVQNLARVDAYITKINHQNEITQVTRWWKEIGLNEELKLARNQLEKWHTWSLVCLPGLNMVEERVEFTKVISFVFIIDDIFDMYGTLEELILFTEAVNRWEYDNVKGLPNYMTICLKNLFELTEEMSDKTYEKYGWNHKEYLQKVDDTGNDGSYLTCYTNEHKGSLVESGREHIHTLISNAWICINETFLSSPFSPHFKAAILNSTRMIPLMYCNDEKSPSQL